MCLATRATVRHAILRLLVAECGSVQTAPVRVTCLATRSTVRHAILMQSDAAYGLATDRASVMCLASRSAARHATQRRQVAAFGSVPPSTPHVTCLATRATVRHAILRRQVAGYGSVLATCPSVPYLASNSTVLHARSLHAGGPGLPERGVTTAESQPALAPSNRLRAEDGSTPTPTWYCHATRVR